MEAMTRRGFVGGTAAMGALGAMSVLGLTGSAMADEGAEAAVQVAPVTTGSQVLASATPADAENPEELLAELTKYLNIKEYGDPAILNKAGEMDPIKFVTDLSNDELEALLEDEAEVTEDYVAPDGRTIPAVYIRLRNRINRMGVGLGSGVVGPNHWDVFMNNWSEEDAEHELEMPMTKWFTPEEYQAYSGRPLEECNEILDSLADRLLIWRHNHNGGRIYSLMTQLPGYWEARQMLLADQDPEQARQFIIDCDNAFAPGMGYSNENHRSLTRIQPPSRDVVEGDLLPYTDWEAALNQHETFVVAPCQCRQRLDLLSEGGEEERACKDNHPVNTCLQYGDVAKFYKEVGIGVELTREEAIDQIKANIDAGYVIDGEINKQGGTFCACHGDCCRLLGGILAKAVPPNVLDSISGYDLLYDKDACIGCGACVERCTMNSITLGDDGVCVMDDYCVRCGQCALVCPVQARKLKARDISQTFTLPEDLFDDSLQMAKIRMAHGRIRDLDGTNAAYVRWEPEDLQAQIEQQG